MKQFLFEWKKVIHTKSYLVLLLFTFLIISGLFLRNVILQDTISIQKVDTFSEYSYQVANGIQGDNFIIEQDENNEEARGRLEIGQLLYDQLNKLISEIQNNKWKEELKTEINVYETAIIYKEMDGPFQASLTDMEETIKYNEKLLQLELPKENMDLSIQPTIFMKKVVSLFLNTFGFLAVILVLSTLVTREIEDQNIRMVLALPISRTNYMITKFISLFSFGSIWLVIILLLSFLIPFLFGNPEEDMFKSPLFTSENNYISTGEYMKKAILYSTLFMTFTVSLAIILGFLFRNTIITYLSSIILFTGTYMMLKNGMTPFLNPFTYQNIDYIILNDRGQYPVGIIILLVFSTLLLILTVIFNRKRGGIR